MVHSSSTRAQRVLCTNDCPQTRTHTHTRAHILYGHKKVLNIHIKKKSMYIQSLIRRMTANVHR